MRLSAKLLGFLNRAFSKDPDAFLALRIQYAGPMTWTVYDGILTTAVSGGPGAPLLIDLSGYTVQSLAGFIARQPGYSVPYLPNDPVQLGAAALRLVEGAGNIYESNGDHLLAYTSILYAWIDAVAVELAAAEDAIGGMADEMSTVSADGSWLDYQGSFYAVPRLEGEPDGLYSRRIIAEVLRPLGNNVAIEAAISSYTGQAVTISDVVIYTAPEPHFDGVPRFDGTYTFLPGVAPLYNLFDALVGYDLLNGDVPTAFLATIKTIIESMRDAGMHLRAINLGGSSLADQVAAPFDSVDTLLVDTLRHFDGVRRFDGTWTFAGDTQDIGTIAAANTTIPLVLQIPLATLMRDGSLLVVNVAAGPVVIDVDASNVGVTPSAVNGGLLGYGDQEPLLGADGAPLLAPS